MSDFFPICHCFEPFRVLQPRNGQNKLLSITDGLQPVDKHQSSDIFVVRVVVVGVPGAVSVTRPWFSLNVQKAKFGFMRYSEISDNVLRKLQRT